MPSKNEPIIQRRYRRIKVAYLIAIVISILLGLLSRKYIHFLSLFVGQNAGDMLWAMMVYFGFRFLLVNKNLFTSIMLGLFFSFSIEFSQLYQAEWINQIRGTLLGALILGKGFLSADLIRYAVGIMIATVLDKMTLIFIQRKSIKRTD